MSLRIVLITLLTVLVTATTASALDLDTAKQKGLVGETRTGYLGIVASNPDSSVKSLVGRINGLRKEEYKKIAKKNGTQLEAVEKISAKKAYEKTPSGQYVQAANGSWVKK